MFSPKKGGARSHEYLVLCTLEVSTVTMDDNHALRSVLLPCITPCFDVSTGSMDDNDALLSVLLPWMTTML